MIKEIRVGKASIILGIILLGALVSIVPTSSAGLIFNFQSVLQVTWGNETSEPLVPRGELRIIPLVITHTVTRAELGEGLLVTLTGALVTIDVSIIDKSSWCTASLSQGTLSVTIKPDAVSIVQTTLTVQVTNDAPANALGYVKIRATAEPTGVIAGFENDFTLNFMPAYKPLIRVFLPGTNAKEIGPMDTAVFPIEMENLGNARTIVLLNVTNIPKDWSILITSQVLLEEGAGSTAIAYLTVKPSKSFGYHYEEQLIRVSLQPVKADNDAEIGEITYQTFLVQSRGFSTPGFETIVFLGAIFGLYLFSLSTRKRKM